MTPTIKDKLLEMHEFMAHPKQPKTLYGYVLDNGSLANNGSPLSEEQLNYLRTMCRRVNLECEPKQCFFNSQTLALADFEDRVVYYEGYTLKRGHLFAHAWITLDDLLVDATLSTRPKAAQEFINGLPPQEDLSDRILGEIPEYLEYYGLPFEKAYIASIWNRHHMSLSLIDNWQDGWPLVFKFGEV